MRIQIDENLFLESDEHNYILREQLQSASGKKRSKFKYFANLESVARYLLDYSIKRSQAQNIKELLSEISAMKAEVGNALRQVI